MTLTPDDIKRPAVIRLNRVINTLTGIVWFPLAFIRAITHWIAWVADAVFVYVFNWMMDARDYLLAAFVKRWPTPKATDAFDGFDAHYTNIARKMTPEETIAQRLEASADKARAAGTYRDTVPTTNDYARATSAVVATFNGPAVER